MHTHYPRMVYLGGDVSAKGYQVPDASVEALAALDGYYPAGEAPARTAPAKPKKSAAAGKKRRA